VVTELRLRIATRALVLDEADRVLLVRMGEGDRAIWVTPGGGIEEGESDEQAIRRELLEETGLEECELGPHVWTRTAHVPLGGGRWDGETERIYLVRAPAFEPTPHFTVDELRAEGVTEIRWWTLDELEAAATPFAPRRLSLLVRELILHGPPAEPIDVGL
jgi:8-oxo-dGTP diphosphatase